MGAYDATAYVEELNKMLRGTDIGTATITEEGGIRVSLSVNVTSHFDITKEQLESRDDDDPVTTRASAENALSTMVQILGNETVDTGVRLAETSATQTAALRDLDPGAPEEVSG